MNFTIDLHTFQSLISQYWVSMILPALIGIYGYVTTTLSLAISASDKNNDGSLSESELEELCIFLIRNAKTPWIKLVPDFVVRNMVKKLCSRRSQKFSTEVPASVIPSGTK